MAHLRYRYINLSLQKALKFSPIVGILGHRQVGKTSLLERISRIYKTMDDFDEMTQAKKNPKIYLTKFTGIKNGIDECQMVPGLFSTLKERVRLNKSPGQFILTGSVRFTSRQAIRESLTGRIVNLELLPFTVSELKQIELPTSCIDILKSKNLTSTIERLEPQLQHRLKLMGEIENYFERGGLPGVCFIRNEKIRNTRILEQLQTILDRDIRQVYPTNIPFLQIMDFFRELSKFQGLPIKYSHFERSVGISEATQKKLLYALEAVFLIRRLPIDGKKGHVLYLEDQAESLIMSDGLKDKIFEFEEFLFRNLRAQFTYSLGIDYRCFHYLTRGKARVPFSFQTQEGILGIIPLESNKPNRSDLGSAASFLKKFGDSKIIFVNRGKALEVIDQRMVIIPAYWLV